MTALTTALLTMSSREIAELTKKRHRDVTRDIEKMFVELGEDTRKFARIYRDSRNREQTEYALDRELTETLLTGYSAVLRRRVIVRMRELEEQLAAVEQTLQQRVWNLHVREVESKKRATAGARALNNRKAEIQKFRIERAELEARIQPSLLI
jgi:phage regulator Rha-like protein